MNPMNLLRLFKRAPPPAAKFPEGRVGFAVGDIHGRADLLGALLERLEARAEAETRPGGQPILVFLGDYVDRGPHSAAVLDLLLSGRPAGYERRFLKGNHEQSLLAFLEAPLENRAWVLHGGMETLRAYDVAPPSPLGASDEDWAAAAAGLKAALPPAHVDFLVSLERYLTLGDYVFVHAGVEAGRTLEQQTDQDLLWSRARFLASRRPFSHRVVHGHTPASDPYADARRIGVDTGAYATGKLTAVRLEGEAADFISVTEGNVSRTPDIEW